MVLVGASLPFGVFRWKRSTCCVLLVGAVSLFGICHRRFVCASDLLLASFGASLPVAPCGENDWFVCSCPAHTRANTRRVPSVRLAFTRIRTPGRKAQCYGSGAHAALAPPPRGAPRSPSQDERATTPPPSFPLGPFSPFPFARRAGSERKRERHIENPTQTHIDH
jgi:hypothetical protein